MITLGVILLIIGFIAKIAILWTIGIILVVIGADTRGARHDGSRGRRAGALLLTLTRLRQVRVRSKYAYADGLIVVAGAVVGPASARLRATAVRAVARALPRS